MSAGATTKTTNPSVGEAEPTAQGRLVLIDGFGIIFRAYHAIKSGLATSKGELTNATFGFTSMLLEVLRRDTPDYIVMAFEGGQTFRHTEFVEYKANRSEMPEDLQGQLGRIREIVEAMGITIYSQEGFEADDVIGTLARQANERGLEALIITGDNDLLQLVNEHTRAVLPGAGPKARFQDARYFDTQGVVDRFGFEPKFVPDYKAIVGDKSDNIPNVPGLGEKTATDLINKYGHVENIMTHLNELKPKVKDALESHRDQVAQSKRLATIVIDVDLKLDIEGAKAGQIDRPKVLKLFQDLEFNSLVRKLDGLGLPDQAEAAAPPPLVAPKTKKAKNGQLSMFDVDREQAANQNPVPVENTAAIPATPEGATYLAVRTRAELDKMIARIQETGRFAFDTETTALDPLQADLVGLSLSPAPAESYYLPIGHRQPVAGADSKAVTELEADQLNWDEAREVLATIFFDPSIYKLAHNANFDLLVLNRAGLDLTKIKVDFDTLLAAQLIGLLKAGLKDLAFNRLGIEMTHIEDLIGKGKNQLTMDRVTSALVTPYACADADMTLRLADDLRPQVERDGLWRLFTEVEMPLVPVLCIMELNGITVDLAGLQAISTELYQKLQVLEKEIYQEAGYSFNINSPAQLGDVLFGKLGLPGGKRTATKNYSTSKEILEGLRAEHAIIGKVLEYRQLGKLKSTYVDSLPLLINPETGRLHTSFGQIGSLTGRISSSEPNLQNIPIRTDVGSEVRRAFIADNNSSHRLFQEPSVLFAADYSQIELRVLAHYTDDPRLVDAFQHDKDIHAATAADLFNVAEDQVTPDMRRLAKTVNFGIIYGLSAHGLVQRTTLTYKEASDFIKAYNEKFPSIKEYLDKTPDQARKSGYVETLDARRRYMPELKNSDMHIRQAAERQAINMPIQGTAADIVKKAMNLISDEMREKGLQSRMLLQVHDELVFEAPKSEVPVLAELVKRNMEGVKTFHGSLSVPLKADLKLGQNWRDMESYKL